MQKYFILIIFQYLFIGNILFSAGSESLFTQGKEALNSGNYKSSELIFRKIIDSNDEYRDRARFYLAISIFRQTKYKPAIFEFRRYLNKCRTSNLCIQSRHWIAESYYHLMEYNKAIEEYKRYITKGRDRKLLASAYNRIGMIYYIQKRFDEAVIEWDNSIRISKDKKKNSRMVCRTGEALFKNNRYDESLKRLKPLMTSGTELKISARARLISGRIFQIRGDHEKALFLFKGIPDGIIKEHPYIEAQYFKALSYIKSGRKNTALPLLKIFTLNAGESEWYYDALLESGNILSGSNKSSEKKNGIKLLEDVRKFSKKSSLRIKASIILSRMYLENRPDTAINYLKELRLLDSHPEHRKVTLLLGRAYSKAKRIKDSVKIFELFIKKYPYDENIDEVYFIQAKAYLENGETSNAKNLFKKIINDNPFSKYLNESIYYLAVANYRSGNIKNTISLLKKYLRHKKIKKRYITNLLLTESYLQIGDVRNVNKIMNLIIKKYIKNEDIKVPISRYAIIIHKKGHNARRYFNFIIKNYPQSNEACKLYLILGNEYFKKSNYKMAEEYYTKYLSGNIEVHREHAYFNRLISIYNMKKYNDIILIVERETMPKLEEEQLREIQLLLSRCYFNVGKYDSVYKIMYNEYHKKYNGNDLLIFIKSSIEVKDLKTAQEASKLLVDNKDLYSESLFFLGNYYNKNKKKDTAGNFYLRVITECPGTRFADFARIELADILIAGNMNSDAINRLLEIKTHELRNRKNSMLIILYFKMKKYPQAVSLTNNELFRLRKSKHGEIVMKTNLEYYYNEKNIKEFKKYAKYLNRYKGNVSFVSYLSGKIYLKKKNFRKSYNYFYRLSTGKSEYKEEALYYTGRLSLFIHMNKKAAIRSFQKIIELKNDESKFKFRARIILAIINYEIKNKKESLKYLLDVIKHTQRGIYYSQACNLLEYYGYR